MNRPCQETWFAAPVVAGLALCLLAGCGGGQSGDTGRSEAGEAAPPEASVVVADIELSPESRALAEIAVETVRIDEVRDAVHTTGEIQMNGRNVARIVSRLPGWVDEVMRIQGDHVRPGDIVLTIHSPEYQTAGGELLSAWNRLGEARANGDSTEISTAGAIYNSARKRLLLYGENDAEIDSLLRSGEAGAVLHVHSPLDGSIIQNAMVPGHRVEPGAELCFISDLHTVWAILDMFEKDLGSAKVGAGVVLNVTAYPGCTFEGRVAFIDNVMDEATRTVKVRVEVNNGDALLKPGMFVEADIAGSGMRRGLTVPPEAVQQEGTEHFVFLARDGRFHRQVVDPGTSSGGRLEIRSGLTAGDSIVVNGAFTLKSELLKSGFGEE